MKQSDVVKDIGLEGMMNSPEKFLKIISGETYLSFNMVGGIAGEISIEKLIENLRSMCDQIENLYEKDEGE